MKKVKKKNILDRYRWLRHEELQPPYWCYIRLAIAHLIKIICGKKVFNNSDRSNAFIRCVVIILTYDNINDFRSLLTSVYIVALTEYNGEDGVKFNLLKRIETVMITDDQNKQQDYDHLYVVFVELLGLALWVNNIHENAEPQDKTVS